METIKLPPCRKRPNDEEHRLQCRCVQWFRYTYSNLAARLFAVPNGGRRDATTGARLKAEGVLAGVSDLILLVPNQCYHALLIEMKAEHGRQSQTQKEWEQAVTMYDEYKYVVCHSFTEFEQTISEYLKTAKPLELEGKPSK